MAGDFLVELREFLWDNRTGDDPIIDCKCEDQFTHDEYVYEGKKCESCERVAERGRQVAHLQD